MAFTLKKKSTIAGNTFEPAKNSGQRVELAKLTSVEMYEGLTITSISVSATAFDMKNRDIINIGGQKLTLSADAAATSTTLSVTSIVLSQDMELNTTIEIDNQNLFVQYQRKTEGTISGMSVSAYTFGPIYYDSDQDTFYITGVDPTYVKILPRDFMINNDGAYEALAFKDGANSGLQVGDSAEMVATVNIPYGTTATHVQIWGSVATKAVQVYECGISTNGIGSVIGSGTTNGVLIPLTDTAATDTNYLLIVVKVTATSQRIYGGQVTLTQN
tara:strand:- start:261 stop:1079 length:819 start_codon:yes stop_codon:yes gene_type:complete